MRICLATLSTCLFIRIHTQSICGGISVYDSWLGRRRIVKFNEEQDARQTGKQNSYVFFISQNKKSGSLTRSSSTVVVPWILPQSLRVKDFLVLRLLAWLEIYSAFFPDGMNVVSWNDATFLACIIYFEERRTIQNNNNRISEPFSIVS